MNEHVVHTERKAAGSNAPAALPARRDAPARAPVIAGPREEEEEEEEGVPRGSLSQTKPYFLKR